MECRCLNLHTLYLNLMDSVSIRCVEVSLAAQYLWLYTVVFSWASLSALIPLLFHSSPWPVVLHVQDVLGYSIRSHFSVSSKGLVL